MERDPAATTQMGTWVLLLPLLFVAEAQAQAQGTGVAGTCRGMDWQGLTRGMEALAAAVPEGPP